MTRHGVCVLAGLAILELGRGSLRHHGTQGLLVGIAGEMAELVVNDAQFLVELFQA